MSPAKEGFLDPMEFFPDWRDSGKACEVEVEGGGTFQATLTAVDEFWTGDDEIPVFAFEWPGEDPVPYFEVKRFRFLPEGVDK